MGLPLPGGVSPGGVSGGRGLVLSSEIRRRQEAERAAAARRAEVAREQHPFNEEARAREGLRSFRDIGLQGRELFSQDRNAQVRQRELVENLQDEAAENRAALQQQAGLIGSAPMASTGLLQQGLAQATQNQMAMAAGQRGNQAAALRNAALANQGLVSDTMGQASVLGAQERMARLMGQAEVLGRAGALGTQQQSLGMGFESALGGSARAGLGLYGSSGQAILGTGLSERGLEFQRQENFFDRGLQRDLQQERLDEARRAQDMAFIGGIYNTGGGLLSRFGMGG